MKGSTICYSYKLHCTFCSKSIKLYPPTAWFISHAILCPWSSSQLPVTGIQTNKPKVRDSTVTLVSYVFPSNSRASYISAPQSTNSWREMRSNRSPKWLYIKSPHLRCGNFQPSHSFIRISSLHPHVIEIFGLLQTPPEDDTAVPGGTTFYVVSAFIAFSVSFPL